MCVQVRRGLMFMDPKMHFFLRHVHIIFFFSFLLAVTSTAPFSLVSQTEGIYLLFSLVLFVLSASAFPSVPCRVFNVGGVSGSGRAELVSVPHLCRPGNVLSAAVCSGGEKVYSRGGEPLCRRGKSKIVFQRSDCVHHHSTRSMNNQFCRRCIWHPTFFPP